MAAVMWACTDAPPPSVPPAIIPLPASMQEGGRPFRLSAKMDIVHDPCASAAAAYLQEALEGLGLEIGLHSTPDPRNGGKVRDLAIYLSCDDPLFRQDDMDEGYHLKVTPQDIQLSAAHATGLFRGVQSLLQLIPPGSDFGSGSAVSIPAVDIDDRPRFAHRGMLLDVCRHFFTVGEVKAYIDLLAFYKMNTLHWHLTEDQGWRIAIDAYPKLTEVGAWRAETEGTTYGGFYSKNDIREVVDYATQRHIRIIPEIEMPGHAQAALAAYPHLSCTGGPHEVANDWGVFKEIYCAGNDSVFLFLQEVLAEVMELFPSRYVHIGGDEAPKTRWEACAKCQKRMNDERLPDAHGLQSWFIGEVGGFLKSHGKTLIGWDEILEGGLNPDAVVQSWRGTEGGIAAARAGQYAVMSPTSHAYFDYDLQAIDLAKVYSFEPVPDELDSAQGRFILGGECNLWTEHIPDRAALDRQAFPRLLAMSEVLWSPADTRDFDGFRQRLRQHYPRLRGMGVQYGAEQPPYAIASHVEDGALYLAPEVLQEDVAIEVSSQGQPLARGPHGWLVPGEGDQHFHLQVKADGHPMGAPEEVTLRAHTALLAEVAYGFPYSTYYPAGGDRGLVDGLRGSQRFRDGRWQGFAGKPVDVTLDLGRATDISRLSIGALQYSNAWIFLPEEVSFFAGADTTDMQWVGVARPQRGPEVRGQFHETLTVHFPMRKARYVRVLAQNIEKVPHWHEAAGSEAWLFVDEIMVE